MLARTASSDADEEAEWMVLQANVRNIAALHPGARVRFLADDDCIRSIRNAVSLLPSNENNTAAISMADRLVRSFQNEAAGMFKADLCRGAALYETGGLYFDVDLGVRNMSLWDALRPETTFATVRVHGQSKHPGSFFQAFIGSTPYHPVLGEYIVLFDQYYRGNLPSLKGKPLGVVLLKRAYDNVLEREQGHREREGNGMTNATSLVDTTEIWQEVLYNPELKDSYLKSVPPPTWGTRRACKFIVIVTRSPDPRNMTVRWPLTVPFYSRIAGSRMCPVKTR